MNDCKIRLVEERDIPILFEHLKQFLETPNRSTTGNPLPLFEDSKKFVMKYLYENENHEYDKWYMVINDEDEILGNVYINKKNMIAYHILEKYQRQGFGETAVKLMMEKNPRKRYFAIVNMKNKSSIEFIKKFKFKEKSFIFEKINDS
jgi:RimJ/RimL family protein N-acetyltransferase